MSLRTVFICLLLAVSLGSSVVVCRSSDMGDNIFVKEATAFARKQGINVGEFTAVSVRDNRQRTFVVVFFEGRSKRPGNYFAVYVNKRSNKAERIHLGR
jgi:hypothetical protein